jgi:hypothetical protein
VVPKSSKKATFGTTIGIIRLGNGLCTQLERHCPEKQIPTTALGSGREICLIDAAGHAERGGQGRQNADKYLKNGLPVFLFHIDARI